MTDKTYLEKKHTLVKKAVDNRKSITIIRSNKDSNSPLGFDSQKKYDAYRKRLTKKQQAN